MATLAAMAAPEYGAGYIRWRVNRSLRNIGLFVVAGGALASWAARRRLAAATALPDDGFVLELDLERQGVAEHVSGRGLRALLSPGARKPLQLSAVVDALRSAGEDERVKGLLALLGAQPAGGLAQVQELRSAVAEFRRRAGDRAPTVAYADAFGEGGSGGTAAFYLASAFDHIFLQPTGLVSVTGLAAQGIYARGFLERWSVKPAFFAREEYKNAASFLLNRTPSGAEREALVAILSSLSSQVVRGIAQGRGLSEKQVRKAIDSAPHLADEAVDLGLVDGALFRDQAVKVAQRLAAANTARLAATVAAARLPALKPDAAAPAPAVGPAGAELLAQLLADPDAEPSEPVKLVPVQRYLAALKEAKRAKEAAAARQALLARLQAAVQGTSLNSAYRQAIGLPALAAEGLQEEKEEAQEEVSASLPTVATLTLQGPIYLGTGPATPFNPLAARDPQQKVASLDVISALRKVREDKAVKAVVLRIDSPGGSAAASDAIHREVLLLRKAGKPVVVSMGNAAASGGYFIAAPASAIVAQPGSITGSIGVLAGKLVFNEALQAYNINSAIFKVGRNADVASPLIGFDRAQRRKMDALIDSVYAQFKRRVEEGRGLSAKEVAKVAKGRVWTGEQALELGLVDRLGGLADALALAKEQAGLPLEEGAVRVKQVYPERKSPLGQMVKLARGESQEGGSEAVPEAAPAAWAAATAQLGLQLTAGEWALLQQVHSGSLAPQCLDPAAERLSASL